MEQEQKEESETRRRHAREREEAKEAEERLALEKRRQEELAVRTRRDQEYRDRLANDEREAAERRARDETPTEVQQRSAQLDAVGDLRDKRDVVSSVRNASSVALDAAVQTVGSKPEDFRGAEEALEAYRIRAGQGILGEAIHADDLAKDRVRSQQICPGCENRKGSNFDDLVQDAKSQAMNRVAGLVTNSIVDKAVSVSVPIGPEQRDPRYEASAMLAEEVRGQEFGANPFVDNVTSAALEGLNTINRRVIGKMDQLGRQLKDFDKAGSSASGGGVNVNLTPRPPPPAGRASTYWPDNPFVDGVSADVADPSAPSNDENPFVTYSREPSPAPAGYVLFRGTTGEPASNVQLMRLTETERNSGDHLEGSQLVCSTSGIGIVLPLCEVRRAQARAEKRLR